MEICYMRLTVIWHCRKKISDLEDIIMGAIQMKHRKQEKRMNGVLEAHGKYMQLESLKEGRVEKYLENEQLKFKNNFNQIIVLYTQESQWTPGRESKAEIRRNQTEWEDRNYKILELNESYNTALTNLLDGFKAVFRGKFMSLKCWC